MVNNIRQQFLCCEFSVSTESDAAASALRFITLGAEQRAEIKHRVEFRIDAVDGVYTIDEENQANVEVNSTDALVTHMYHRAYQHMQQTLPSHVALHSGCADYAGTRFLFCGDSGAGKTTLAANLCVNGVGVGGDETVLLQNAAVTPVPRRYMLKPASRHLVPHIDCWDQLPTVKLQTERVRAYDPTEQGIVWSINTAPVDWILSIAKTRQPAPTIAPSSKVEMIRHLMSQTYACWNHSDRSKWISEITELVRNACCATLTMGTPTETVAAIKEFLKPKATP